MLVLIGRRSSLFPPCSPPPTHRVKLQGQLAVGALDLGVAGGAGDLQDVVIAFAAGGGSGGNGRSGKRRGVSPRPTRAQRQKQPSMHSTPSISSTHRAAAPATEAVASSTAQSAAATAARRRSMVSSLCVYEQQAVGKGHCRRWRAGLEVGTHTHTDCRPETKKETSTDATVFFRSTELRADALVSRFCPSVHPSSLSSAPWLTTCCPTSGRTTSWTRRAKK